MSTSTASTAKITRGMLKIGSRFTGGSDGTAGSYAGSRFSARQVGQKEKGGLSPSMSIVAGVLHLDGWSHPIASRGSQQKPVRQDLHRLSHMDKRALTSRAHPANRALVLTLIAVPRLQTSADIAPAPHVMPRQGAVCLSLRGTSATPPGRGRQVLGNNEASHDAGTVGYSRYACRDFILTADFVNEIRVRLAGTVSVRCSSREIKGEAFEDRRAANRCANLSPPSSTKMLALLQAFLVALNRAPK